MGFGSFFGRCAAVFRFYPRLSLYIARHLLLSLLGTLLVIMGLVLMLDFIELIRRAAGRTDAGTLTLLGMALLKLPTMVHQILPFAVLIGAMSALWKLTRSHELVIFRSVGVSIWQILGPAMMVAGIVGTVNVTVINPLSAAMYKAYERMEDRLILHRNGSFDLSQNGLWLRETQGSGGQVVVHASNVHQDGMTLRLRDVSFLFIDNKNHFTHRLDAAIGTLEGNTFQLEDVWEMLPGKPPRHSDTISLPTTLSLGRVQENFASPETLSFWELPRFIAFFDAAGFSTQQHRMYWHSLLASPFLLCAMVLMAAIFSVNPNTRSGNGVMRVVGGVGSGFVLYFFNRLTFALGLSATLPLWLAAWSPTLITISLGVATLLHLEDG